MMLHCTLVPAPGSALAPVPVELACELPAACPGAELQSAVSRRYGTGALTVDGAPLASLTAGEPPLVHGAVLVDGPVPPRRKQAGPPVEMLLLAVHGGPGAGTVVPLRRGRFRIGRSGTEVAIPDAELSREHARLDVSDSSVSLLDLNSANGSMVDGRRVRETPVTTESWIRCGNSSLSLIFTGSADAGVPASAGCSVAEPLLVASPPMATPRGVLVATAVVPLAIGTGLAVVTGMWMFLAFTAVSAVSLLVPAVSGRRQRRELRSAVGAAVRADMERRRRSAPSAADLVVRRTAPGPGPGPGPILLTSPIQGHIWLRLGLAEQMANIRLEPPVAAFRPPSLGLMPVTLDPAPALTTVRGPQSAVSGLVRSFLMQLVSYPLAGRTRVLLHGSRDSLPLGARFLAAATLSGNEAATLAAMEAGPGDGYDRGLIMILAGAGSSLLSAAAVSRAWRVIDCSATSTGSGPGPAPGQSIVLGERKGLLTSDGSSLEFIPDLVPQWVFDRFCRRFGAGSKKEAAAAPPPSIPDACSLADVLPISPADISRRWTESARHPGLPAIVGIGGAGPQGLDLQADGPHFLIAGTTGSGKSELLRTLSAALAACHPPSRINLLFIDFKGGSGLEPLTGLPHCVGFLTDLDGQQIGRALVSLRAEVRRREELLAACRAPDLAAYERLGRTHLPLPHLVLVVDEFRMLVVDAPEALAELMRIATIGRSLGIHLVMATQRPQGSVTADIRANVTSCIALRVQSGMESIDIINSKLAAAIPISLPGRAYIARGNEAPEEFQTAALARPAPRAVAGTVAVMTAADFLCRMPARAYPDLEPTAAPIPALALALDPLIAVTGALWQQLGGRPPRRPVADPLPAPLPFPPGPLATDVQRGAVRLGMLDLPEQQRTRELLWSPAGHGHLGLVGGAPATDAALALAVEQLLSAEHETHLYVLDAAGSFNGMQPSSRVGARVGPHELRRAARVIERLAEEMTVRLGTGANDQPELVLVLGGWGSWVSGFRAGPLAWAEDLVHDIVRDGAEAGITVVASGQRELVTARFFAAIPNRAFFPAGSTEEGRVAWPRLPFAEALPGRMVAFGPFAEGTSTAGHTGQLFEPPGIRRLPRPQSQRRPFRIEQLPRRVSVPEVLSRGGVVPPPAHGRLSLCLGVGGDELLPVRIQLPAAGVLAILGASGSGKSTALSTLGALNPGLRWLRPPAEADPDAYWSVIHNGALAGSLDRGAVLLADDLDRQSAGANDRLLMLNSLGWPVILTAGFGPSLLQRVPLAVQARSHGQGLLIAPRSLPEGELFGVRFELDPHPPPGRAVMISGGRATAVQLAFDPAAGTGAP